MKKYRHKKTGNEVSYIEDEKLYRSGPFERIPKWVIEESSDWELVVPVKTEDGIAKSIVQEIWDVIDEGLNNEYRESQTLAKIEQIIASNSKVPVVEEIAGKGSENSQKALFKTEDGVDIYSYTHQLYIVHDGTWNQLDVLASSYGSYWSWKWFSTAEDRQEFIEYNKPSLSQREVIELLSKTAKTLHEEDFVEEVKFQLTALVMDKLTSK